MLALSSFDMLSGRNIVPLPATEGSWTVTTNADESITCTIPARDPNVRRLQVWANTPLARSGLLAEIDGMPVAAGPIWKRKYDTKAGAISLTAGGLWSYWNRRLLLPVTARTAPLVNLTTGDPDASLDVNVTGFSYGTMAKKWIQLAQLWPNGAVPMQFPADEVGTRVKPVAAIDLKMVGKMIEDLSNLENGPDFAFRPRRSLDGLGIYWEFQHGSATVPRLGSTDATNTKWTYGAPLGGAAFDLKVGEDATDVATEAWLSGGASGDKVVIARAESAALLADGFPLLGMVDGGHSDVTTQTTAQSYANGDVKLASNAASFWSMSVRAHEKKAPQLGDYWLGDLVTITVDKREGVLPPGDFVRRIASIQGDLQDNAYDLTFAAALA